MKMKKILAVCLSALTVTGMLAGCGGAKGGDTSSAGAEKEGSSAEGSVYYLNFKPEIADQWEEIAAKLYGGDRCSGKSKDSSIQSV